MVDTWACAIYGYLMLQVRNLKNLGFRVPLAIVNKAHQANQLYPFAISLIESVRTYERTLEKVSVCVLVCVFRKRERTKRWYKRYQSLSFEYPIPSVCGVWVGSTVRPASRRKVCCSYQWWDCTLQPPFYQCHRNKNFKCWCEWWLRFSELAFCCLYMLASVAIVWYLKWIFYASWMQACCFTNIRGLGTGRVRDQVTVLLLQWMYM